MSAARYVVCDVFDGIASLEDGSVDLLLTSPPFLALRSYLPADHPDKAKEIGSEPTPEAFIDTLLDLVEAVTPKLSKYGTIAIELGDTYSGSGGAGGDYSDEGLRAGQNAFDGSAARVRAQVPDSGIPSVRPDTHGLAGGETPWPKSVAGPRRNAPADRAAGLIRENRGGDGWPLPKSLALIPESFRWALVYGRNPFNGRTTERWRARNVVRWCRPNPPVGALGDKFRPATSEMVIACKAKDRWFDLDSVREVNPDGQGVGKPAGVRTGAFGESATSPENGGNHRLPVATSHPAGAPPLDWWEIPTEPYKESHYATWPRRLLTRPIEAMCPRQVCVTCGEPRRRIVDSSYVTEPDDATRIKTRPNAPSIAGALDHPPEVGWEREHRTLGWSDCGHDNWRRGLVLDCFAGSGTTLAVAVGHGRDAIGLDLDARNAELARDRVGPMFISVETLAAPTPCDGAA